MNEVVLDAEQLRAVNKELRLEIEVLQAEVDMLSGDNRRLLEDVNILQSNLDRLLGQVEKYVKLIGLGLNKQAHKTVVKRGDMN